MALSSQEYSFQGEVSVSTATLGTINSQTALDVDLAVPVFIDTTYSPSVSVASLDAGLTIGPAWVSAAGNVKVRIANFSSGNVTPVSALTFKVIVL